MPSIIIKIKWDWPNDPCDKNWLNADNVAIALHAYCKNTKFIVSSAEEDIRIALAELDMPDKSYPASIANAVEILQKLIG